MSSQLQVRSSKLRQSKSVSHRPVCYLNGRQTTFAMRERQTGIERGRSMWEDHSGQSTLLARLVRIWDSPVCSLCRLIENELFRQDWRSRKQKEILQYVTVKWTFVFLVGLFTGLVAFFINLSVENIAGLKFLYTVRFMQSDRYFTFPSRSSLTRERRRDGPWWTWQLYWVARSLVSFYLLFWHSWCWMSWSVHPCWSSRSEHKANLTSTLISLHLSSCRGAHGWACRVHWVSKVLLFSHLFDIGTPILSTTGLCWHHRIARYDFSFGKKT